MRRPAAPKKSAYPARGTPFGDQDIGRCDGPDCGRDLKRGDSFVVNLAGQLLCIYCKDGATACAS